MCACVYIYVYACIYVYILKNKAEGSRGKHPTWTSTSHTWTMDMRSCIRSHTLQTNNFLWGGAEVVELASLTVETSAGVSELLLSSLVRVPDLGEGRICFSSWFWWCQFTMGHSSVRTMEDKKLRENCSRPDQLPPSSTDFFVFPAQGHGATHT